MEMIGIKSLKKLVLEARSNRRNKASYLGNKKRLGENRDANWDTAETTRLLDIIEEIGITDWDDVSARFGSSRSKNQIQKRYSFLKSKSVADLPWDPSEDKQLIEILSRDHTLTWGLVSRLLGGNRTADNCAERWKLINPFLNYGPWSNQELSSLDSLAESLKYSWDLVSIRLKSRTPAQCEKEWISRHIPNLQKGQWTHKETQKLHELHEKHGNSWVKIALELGTRSPRNCFTKFQSTKGFIH
ncbi:hypothetical protein DSO57_1018778 [Entomophthora muscae]|uniref:Uncharacterized protein n=1 Tax=Entomophthora muscae TaxID=34485 RepID=A0ACC2SGX0_9FUNG|nr:hypothetical protein DSO57_1018778 [Entomophthora muscae]